MWERALLVAGALCLIKPGLVTDLVGLGLIAVVFVTQKTIARNLQPDS
ncbi:MAG: FxsA family protein [Ferrovibrio sp.]